MVGLIAPEELTIWYKSKTLIPSWILIWQEYQYRKKFGDEVVNGATKKWLISANVCLRRSRSFKK